MESVKFSREELESFSELFAVDRDPDVAGDDSAPVAVAATRPSFNLTTEEPGPVAAMLGGARLTLLAELGHYRLIFPLCIRQDDLGQVIPELGVPEVQDSRCGNRCWRLTDLHDVVVTSARNGAPVEVLSLSSNGMTLRRAPTLSLGGSLLLALPGLDVMSLAVRHIHEEKGVIAVDFVAPPTAREALMQFIFHRHRALFAHLYKDVSPAA